MGYESAIEYARTEDGAHIAYQVLGDGPIDLLQPSGGSYISIDTRDEEPRWQRFDRRLASFSRLIRYDVRGVGLSDPISPSSPPSIEDSVSDAVAVLDAVGSERAAVLGQGRGGLTTLMLSAVRPERVVAQVLGHAFARLTAAPDYPEGVPVDEFGKFVSGVVGGRDAADPVDDVALLLPSLSDDPTFRKWWQRSGRAGASPAVAQSHYEIAMRTDLRPILPTITTPTLVLHRKDTRYYPTPLGRYLAANLPDARYVELEGADHFLWAGDADPVLDEIERFLTGEVRNVEVDRLIATVLFTDIVGSTDRLATLGDRGWRELLDRHHLVVRQQLDRFGGREVKTIGDGFLATFEGPARAIRSASEICRGVRELGIEVRAGLHAGEVERIGDDIGGMSVHIGARVSSLAQPSEVLVSRSVVDLVAGSGIEFDDRGEHVLKGVPGSWQLYAVSG